MVSPTTADVDNNNSSNNNGKSGGYQIRRSPTPLPMTMAAASALAAAVTSAPSTATEGKHDETTTATPSAAGTGTGTGTAIDQADTIDSATAVDGILLSRSISMKVTRSFHDYVSSLAARNMLVGPNRANTAAADDDRDEENDDDDDDDDESYVHPAERSGWDVFGGNPWAGDRSAKTEKKTNASSTSLLLDTNRGESRDPPTAGGASDAAAHQLGLGLGLSATLSDGGDSFDTYTAAAALGSPSLDAEVDADNDDAYLDDSMCSYASWCGSSQEDADLIGPITIGRVASDVKALLLGRCGPGGRGRGGGGRGGGGGGGLLGRGGSFAEDATISTFGSAEGQTLTFDEEDDYSLASELSADVGGGGGSVGTAGSKRRALFTNFATVRQRERPPPMPSCREEEEDDEEDEDEEDILDACGDDLTLSNRRRRTAKRMVPPASPRSLSTERGGGRAVGSTLAAAGAVGAIPLRRVVSETSRSQYGLEVTDMQHKRQLSASGETSAAPIAAEPSTPGASSPVPSQVGAHPTHVTPFDNVIDLRTPKPVKRSKSFNKTETLKRRKEVEARLRAEHRAARAQRDREKAAEKAKLDAIRSKQEKERRIAQAAEAEARRIEKEEERARKMEEKEQRKHELELAAAREEQQREEERARKAEEKRLEAEAKARAAEERRKAQAAEAEQKRLDREAAKEEAREQKLAAAAQKKAAAEEKKRAKKSAKRAKKDKTNDIAADGSAPVDVPQSGGEAHTEEVVSSVPAVGPTTNDISASDPAATEKEGTNGTDATIPATNDEATKEASPMEASGGIFDALGAATAAGALMMSDLVKSIADPVGISDKRNNLSEQDASTSTSADPFTQLMSGFGFGEPAKSEVSDLTDKRDNFLSSTSSETPAETNPLITPSIPETSEVDETMLSDTEATRNNEERKKKEAPKKASVAALVTGAFARTRSMSRLRDRDRESKHKEETREMNERQVGSKSSSDKKREDKPAKRRRSASTKRERSSSRGAPDNETKKMIAQTSAEVPPSVVRNRAIVYQSFSNDPISSLKMYKFISSITLPASSDDAFIKVQASTVSFSDCLIRQGIWWGTGSVSLPATPGVDVVGRVCNITENAANKYGIGPGDYVAALIRCGGNARYVKASGSSLVKVPASVDPAAAACMVETYLSAFQSLHVGEPPNSRYSFNCHAGKSILIIGGISMVGQAMIELARLAGAPKVYATARQKHHKFLRSIGAIPLPISIDEWLPAFAGQMDIVVDAYCIDHYDATVNCLNQGGKLVCIRSKPLVEEQDLVWHVDASADRIARFFGKMICTYDIFESWEENLSLCKNDLRHLFDMLHQGRVKPPIADCISLSKVAETQKVFEARRVQGFFVCKPWLK